MSLRSRKRRQVWDIPELAVTSATFRELHVKLPTERYREQAAHAASTTNLKPSDQWLDKHRGGFLLIQNLHPKAPPGKCILVESIDTRERFVNKRLQRYAPDWNQKTQGTELEHTPYKIAFDTWAPPDLRFARLSDPHVEVQLPNEPYFPKLYGYGFPSGHQAFDSEGKPDIFSLYFKRFNGGTLENLMLQYAHPEIGAPIPEPFVWHVMKQLSRAVIWLQTDLIRQDLDQGMKNPKPGHKILLHRRLRERDVFLHFPEDGEDTDPLDCCFHRIILGEFDQAVVLEDPPDIHSHIPRAAGETGAWEDMHSLGRLLRRLVTVHDCTWENNGNFDYDVDEDCEMRRFLSDNITFYEGQEQVYSDDLIRLLSNFEQKVTGAIPTVAFLINELLPRAHEKLREFRAMGIDVLTHDESDGWMGDVSWAAADPNFETTPYA
ncbi:hypothetical protein N656DRAFT_718287, partial [Canariomyces notabilis]